MGYKVHMIPLWKKWSQNRDPECLVHRKKFGIF